MSGIGCIILAAGKGTRFKSDKPKILHDLHGRSVLQNILDVASAAGLGRPAVVIGHKADEVRLFLKGKAIPVVQKKQLGTADAVKAAESKLSRFEDVVILYGDAPLVKPGTIRSLINKHRVSGASCTLLTAYPDDPAEYGRIVRAASGGIKAIVEYKEASDSQRKIREINVGLYCFDRRDLYSAIREIRRSKVKKEYYLTDLIAVLLSESKKVSAIVTDDPDEAVGINSRADLAKAFSILNKRAINKLIDGSVTVLDPLTTHISPGAKIGRDTVIYPFVFIEKDVKIGKRCSIGPFCRLRPGTVIEDDAEIGNFVEVVRSKIGKRTKSKHLTYLGDAIVGNDVNVGCGTITANFDGKKKNKTVIGDKARVGSGTIFVAPVKIGKGAVTGAGCVILKNKDVPAKAVVVGVPGRVLKKAKI